MVCMCVWPDSLYLWLHVSESHLSETVIVSWQKGLVSSRKFFLQRSPFLSTSNSINPKLQECHKRELFPIVSVERPATQGLTFMESLSFRSFMFPLFLHLLPLKVRSTNMWVALINFIFLISYFPFIEDGCDWAILGHGGHSKHIWMVYMTVINFIPNFFIPINEEESVSDPYHCKTSPQH